MSKFYEHIMQENEIICSILKTNNEMHMMTEKQKNDYDVVTHCHVSGKFLYAACNNCNLQLKVTSRKRKKHVMMMMMMIMTKRRRTRWR